MAAPTQAPEVWLSSAPARLESQLRFLMEIERLRGVLRGSPVMGGERKENSAEHSWHLALFSIVLAEWSNEDISVDRVVRMLLIHDIVEVDASDVPLFSEMAPETKREREEQAADRIFGLLPDDQGAEMRALWAEFETGGTQEARFARALDRLQPILLNHAARGGTWTDYNVDVDRDRRLTEHIAEGSAPFWQVVEAVYREAVAGRWLRARSASDP